MLYLIGGAARSGKTTLARRLLDARRIPHFCLDCLTSGLETGAAGLGVRHEMPDKPRGELVWPVLGGLLRNVVEVEPDYVVEGDVLLPGRVRRMREVRARLLRRRLELHGCAPAGQEHLLRGGA